MQGYIYILDPHKEDNGGLQRKNRIMHLKRSFFELERPNNFLLHHDNSTMQYPGKGKRLAPRNCNDMCKEYNSLYEMQKKNTTNLTKLGSVNH